MASSFSQALAGIELSDSNGSPVRLGSLWKSNPAVVVFLRHYGWIFCREHIAQLREHEADFRVKGAKLAAIGLGDLRYAAKFREEMGIKFPLLIDEGRSAYRAAGLKSANLLHLLRSDNARARNRAQSGGFRQHKLGQNPFQLGGSFVFGPGNVDRYAHVSQTFGDNAPVEELLAALP
jgi:peroxiredoxin